MPVYVFGPILLSIGLFVLAITLIVQARAAQDSARVSLLSNLGMSALLAWGIVSVWAFLAYQVYM